MNTAAESEVTPQLWPPPQAAHAWTLSRLPAGLLLSRLLFVSALLSVMAIGVICTVNALQWVDKPFAGFLLNERMVVGNVGQYHWTGTQAALKYPDKIVTANGVAVASMQDLDRVIQRAPVGSPVRYTVERYGQTREVVVATMRFTWGDLLASFGITFLIGLAHICLGALVFILRPDITISWLFFFFCFLVSIYNIAVFDVQSTHWGFARLWFSVLAIFPATLIHLGLIFPERKSVVERHPYLPVVFYLGSLALLIPLQVFYPDPAFLRAYQPILAYVALSTVVFVASVLNAGFRAPSIVAKQRARVILVGAGLAFPLTLFTQYISLFAGDLVASLPIQINLAAVPVILFPAAVAYAMVKHNLFDIDTFVRRTCGYVLSTAAIVAAYGLLVSLLNVTVRGADISRSPAFSLVFALAIVFVFEPLHKRLQDIVDHMFYRQQYDYRKTVKEIGETMMSLLEPALIHRTLLGSVVNEMTLENGVVLTPDRAHGGGYQIQLVEGVEREALPATPLAVDEPLLQVLQEKKDLLFRHELELHPQYQAHRAVLRPVFDRFAAEVMVPVRYKEETLGIVSLGRKKSGKMFTLEDVDFLKTITNQSAMALENARLFREYLEKGRLDEELKIAHNIQMSMLPTKAPAVAGFEIAARSLPARQVGGDFYDFLEIQHNGRGSQLGVVVGDVSGKAMSAALLMAASRSVFRVLSESHFSVEEVMTRGNQRLKKDIKKGMFVALLYAVVDPTRKILTLSSAGQTQPIICRGDGSSPTYIETAGDKFPLGIVANSHYQETCISLQPHDTVVLYTDGMVEAMNEQKEMYGFERLLAAIERGRDLTASSLLDSLMNEVSHFVGNAEQHDDLTVVVLKVD